MVELRLVPPDPVECELVTSPPSLLVTWPLILPL